MATIYFDTNFYVDLAWAEDDAADTILDSLNELDVRGVFSYDIMRELLPHTYHPDRDKLLVRRLKRLERGFLYLDEGTWDWLLLNGDEREKVREEMMATRAQMDVVESWSTTAGKSMTEEEAEEMVEENREQFAAMGMLDDEGNLDPLGGVECQRQMIESLPDPLSLKKLLLEMMELVKSASTASQDERERLNVEIQARLGHVEEIVAELAPDVYEQMQSRDDIFRNDDRPKDIVLNRHREKRLQQVSNSYRDAGHIGRFIANSDEIDFLQLDGPNFRRFHDPATKEPSRLEKLGLLDRCFAVAGLDELVLTVRDLLARGK